ncbi:MAG: GAF domain-containing protein, partial [Cyanobacteria bacterium P01_D01_bin.73]
MLPTSQASLQQLLIEKNAESTPVETSAKGGQRASWTLSLAKRQNQVLEKIVEGEPLTVILDDLAQVIEAHSDGELYCSFLLLDQDSQRLCFGAAPSLPEAYGDWVNGIPIGPKVGSCGTAAYFTASVTVEDIATDPLWDGFRELALGFGLKACWSTPVLGRDNRVLATMAIYHSSPYRPTISDRRLVDRVTHLARIAIERQLTEMELKLANESLEQKVEQRTRDLEKVVRNLQEQVQERKAAESRLRVQTRVLEQALKDLQRAQMKMVQSEKMSSLGQLVAGVAHEINNPVSFIHGNLRYLEDYTNSLLKIVDLY